MGLIRLVRRWMTVAVILLACTLPAVGDLEEGIGRVMAEAFIAQRGRMSQPIIDEWVATVGEDLLEYCPRRDLHYRFLVLDSPEANGFALPGGWVFVTAGLLESLQSEDELAAVLGHELAHLADRDFQRHVKRAALFYGLAELLRSNDRGDWVPLLQAVQLVNTLRHSRRQEAQADHVAATIAWRAGYDARAMTSFLGHQAAWSYLQTVFATHPHPAKRAERVETHVAELRADDPQGAVAIARSLAARGRLAAAARFLQEPLPGAEEQRRELLMHLRPPAPDGRAGPSRTVGLAPQARQELQAAADALARAREASEEARSRAWRRLKAMHRDADVNRALMVAQALDPEVRDVKYLALLAQAADLMLRAMRGGNLVARTLNMRETTLRRARRTASELAVMAVAAEDDATLAGAADETVTVGADPTAHAASVVEEAGRLAGAYHDAARMVAPILLELAAAGERDPLGKLVFSRFLVRQAQVTGLDERLDDLDARAEAAASEQWRCAVDTTRLALTAVGLQADPALREALTRITARRARAEPAEVQGAWREHGGLGEAAVALINQRLEPDPEVFGTDLRACYIMLRLNLVEGKEQVDWKAKNRKDNGREDTGAVRGAVGHPQ